MTQVGSARRVIAVAPMPPEKSAYALARYSRSPDSIEDSIRWVHAHSSEKFWEQFYFAYGHASIADLGHVIVCFEHIFDHGIPVAVGRRERLPASHPREASAAIARRQA